MIGPLLFTTVQNARVRERVDHLRAARVVAAMLNKLESQLGYDYAGEESDWSIDGSTVHFTNKQFSIDVRRKDNRIAWIMNLIVNDKGGSPLLDSALRRRAEEWRYFFVPTVGEWKVTKRNLNLLGAEGDGKHRWYSESASPKDDAGLGLKSIGVGLDVVSGTFQVLHFKPGDEREVLAAASSEDIRSLPRLPTGWRRSVSY